MSSATSTPKTGGLHEWTVTGMDCGSCAGKVRRAVERIPGVSDVDVALMQEKLSLILDPVEASTEKIEAVVKSLGYGIAPTTSASVREYFVSSEAPALGVKPGSSENASTTSQKHEHLAPIDDNRAWYLTGRGRQVIITGLLLATAWCVQLLVSHDFARAAFVLASLIGLAPVSGRAFGALRAGIPFTIEMLMTIAAIGALFIDAAEEAALVVFLFTVGELLEGVAATKARDSIRALATLVPKTALLEEGGTTRQIDAAALRIGQSVLVRPGDRIPADGEIAEGISGIDESPITGESVPKTKGPDDTVFAGSINTEATLRISVTRVAEDNTISRIVKLVEEAESARAPTQRFIDRFSRIYMPAIVCVALLVALVPTLGLGQEWGTWIYRALALLLIGCPCALVISVPASIASALSSGARRGLLMKGGSVIEEAAKTTHVAFDKTGTLTKGRPRVTDIVPLAATPAELLAVAAGIETGSSHPLAEAIAEKAADEGVTALATRGAKALAGKGVEAIVGGEPAWIGSPRYAVELGALEGDALRNATLLENEGKTVVVVFRKRTLGLLALRDEPRADATDGIQQLQGLCISTVMLTGDNRRTAKAIAERLGIEYRAELMPEDKVAEIRRMTASGSVMMIGDGINDAPALASATVGAAMGSGTDVALETADAAILRDRVVDVAATIRLSRAAMKNIRQNVTIALGLKGVFLVTSIFGITGLWIAILADTGATVLVTLNALRLLSFNPDRSRVIL